MDANSQLRTPGAVPPMERWAKQGNLRGGLFPYDRPDKNIYAGLGKPASAPENQPGPGGMLAPQQLRGAQNGQTQTAVAGAGPSGEGGATGNRGGGGDAPGVPGSQGRVLRLEVPEAVKNYRSPLPEMFPATAAKLRQGGAERSEALNQGKYIKAGFSAVGDAVSAVPKIADDVLGGFTRGSFDLLRNPVEDAGRAALGMEDRKESATALRTPAPATPNQTAAPQVPNSQAYQLRQGTLGENDNAYHGDLTGKINAAMKSGQTDLASTGMRANDIYKTKSANGTTSYSGYGDGSGRLGDLVSGDGTSLRTGGSVSSVPGMGQEAIAQTLRNPDGSTWSAQDNAVMAANLRDGVNQYQGTSRAEQEAKPMSINAYRARTERRGQDMSASTTLRGQDLDMQGRRLTNESNKLRLQFDMGKDKRDFDEARGNKAFDQAIQGTEALHKKVLNSLPFVKGDKGPEPDAAGAAAYMNGANAAVARRANELRKAGRGAEAAQLEDQGVANISASDHQNLVDGIEMMKRFSEKNSEWFTSGTSGKMSNNPLDFLVVGPDPKNPKKVLLAGGQTMDMDDVAGMKLANRFGLPQMGNPQTDRFLPK